MPHVYITDEAKAKLDNLIENESPKTTISREIEFLIEKRIKDLNISDVSNQSDSGDNSKTNTNCQEES